MRNKSFGPKKLRLVHCEDQDWLDLLSCANPRELNGLVSDEQSRRDSIIRARR
jgi:hypothetical protein